MSKVTEILKTTKMTVSKRSPEILTAIGIAGMVSTTVLAVKATPKAIQLMEKERMKKGVSKLTPSETVKVTWKVYIPSVTTGVVSAACLIGATSVSTRRTAAIAAAYKISETALSEFKEKAIETVGEKKVKEIKEKIVEDKLKKNPVTQSPVIMTDHGKTLCYDSISGRYFECDIEQIRKAENKVNRQMTYDMYVSLSEFYDEIGLPPTKISDEIGWNLDDGLLNIEFGYKGANDGRPCVVLNYDIAPKYDFSRLY